MIGLYAAVVVLTLGLVMLARQILILQDAVEQLQDIVLRQLDPEHETRGQADT